MAIIAVFFPALSWGQVYDLNIIIPRLILCESGGRSVKHLDTNNKYSYGVLQIQSSTAKMWNKEAGTDLDPMRPQEAITLAIYAIEKGYGKHWTCWRTLGLGRFRIGVELAVL